MAPKKGTNKKSTTKLVTSSSDAAVFNNGEKEVAEDSATDTKILANGTSLNGADHAIESLKSKTTKRSSGRVKNNAEDLETVAPSKKPASKVKGKKKPSENEVIEEETNSTQAESQFETKIDENKTKPKGRGGGGKKGETKKSANAKQNKEVISTENEQEENSNQVEIPGSEKNTKVATGRKGKQEILSKAAEQMETNPSIKEEVGEEKSFKKISKNIKKSKEDIDVETEPEKKKGKSVKKEKLAENEEVDVKSEVEIKSEVEKKTTKRGRATAKAVTATEEIADTNGDAEVVLPKKRSRKSASVENEIVTEKPKRGRSKKADKMQGKIAEEDSDLKPIADVEIETNGQMKKEKESAISNKKVGKQIESAAPPVLTAAAKGGRKRAAPSTSKKSSKTIANDEQLDDGVDNAELVDEADDSKPSKAKKGKTDAGLANATATKYNKADFDLPPPNDGQTAEEPRFNFKISSWNVAGLRSWLKKDGLKFLEYEQPDIFCMQETKCTNDQLPEEVVPIPGYHPYWLCMPGGYAGVAIYSKIMPINVDYGIGNKSFDDCGRIITAEYEKFFLINVYVPNSGRKLVNLETRMKWEKLFQEFVQNLDARKPVVICGDMNVSHQEHDLANPKSNTRSAGFTKEERDKMTELLALGYIDTFRHLYPDRKGAYTYWTYMANARSRNVGWRLDYFIVSERFINRVVDNCIRSQCMGSDHCPITLFLKL